MLAFIKKHWKGFLTGLAVVLAFLGGIFANSRRTNLSSGGANRNGTPGHEAASQIDSQRLAGNIGKAIGQAGGIADDNRRASDQNNQLGKDVKGLADLADRIDSISTGSGK